MCGIIGGININPDKFSDAKRIIRHRGPDETGDFLFDNLYFYHVRLSIQDIKTGQQPFHADGFSIIFNGEIYNHIELRERFHLSCRTNSDTETILVLYQKLGKEFLHLLDGMFAFAIFDKKNRKLFLARDRAGEKPLYYFFDEKSFAFASELNSLKSIVNPEIEFNNIYQYLRYSFVGSNTPYKNVMELQAGSYFEINIDTLKSNQENWWKIEEFYPLKSTLSFNETVEKIDELLQKSVYNRLKTSDLEVGTFLSGGIDSGLVTAIASKYKNNLKTFTVSFAGQYDESSLAELVAKKYNTHHTKISIAFDDLKNNLENILSNYGEPFGDSSAIPSYYVSREAKKHLTVILNGDGADELFGGYRRYVPFARYDFFKSPQTMRGLAQILYHLLPLPDNKRANYNYIFRLIDFARKDPLQAYLSATIDTFEGYTKYIHSTSNPFGEIELMLNKLNSYNLSGLKKIMCLDFNFILANDLLVKMDIATMAHSLEGRTPFFNKEILEFVPTINDKYKINGVVTKYILRELAKKYLPKELINQPKRGFEIPLRSWMENDLKEITFDYLSGKTFSENFVSKNFIDGLLYSKIKLAPEKRAKMLWRLLALEIWHRKCYCI